MPHLSPDANIIGCWSYISILPFIPDAEYIVYCRWQLYQVHGHFLYIHKGLQFYKELISGMFDILSHIQCDIVSSRCKGKVLKLYHTALYPVKDSIMAHF